MTHDSNVTDNSKVTVTLSHRMPRNELLVFRILDTLRRWRNHPLQECSLLEEVSRESENEYSVETVKAHIQTLLQQGLLKQVRFGGRRAGYALDWPGYDYLEPL